MISVTRLLRQHFLFSANQSLNLAFCGNFWLFLLWIGTERPCGVWRIDARILNFEAVFLASEIGWQPQRYFEGKFGMQTLSWHWKLGLLKPLRPFENVFQNRGAIIYYDKSKKKKSLRRWPRSGSKALSRVFFSRSEISRARKYIGNHTGMRTEFDFRQNCCYFLHVTAIAL